MMCGPSCESPRPSRPITMTSSAPPGALKAGPSRGHRKRVVYDANHAPEAIDDWLAARGEEDRSLLCPVRRGGRVGVRPMTSQAVLHILRRRPKQAGVEPFTPHDLRRADVHRRALGRRRRPRRGAAARRLRERDARRRATSDAACVRSRERPSCRSRSAASGATERPLDPRRFGLSPRQVARGLVLRRQCRPACRRSYRRVFPWSREFHRADRRPIEPECGCACHGSRPSSTMRCRRETQSLKNGARGARASSCWGARYGRRR